MDEANLYCTFLRCYSTVTPHFEFQQLAEGPSSRSRRCRTSAPAEGFAQPEQKPTWYDHINLTRSEEASGASRSYFPATRGSSVEFDISTAAEKSSRDLQTSVTQRFKLATLPATPCLRSTSLPLSPRLFVCAQQAFRMSCKALAITALLCIAFGAAVADRKEETRGALVDAGEASKLAASPCDLLLRQSSEPEASVTRKR